MQQNKNNIYTVDKFMLGFQVKELNFYKMILEKILEDVRNK